VTAATAMRATAGRSRGPAAAVGRSAAVAVASATTVAAAGPSARRRGNRQRGNASG